MQGATYLYLTYFEPTIASHESEIEDFIAKTHDRARAAGLQYFKQAIDWIRVNVLKQAGVGSDYATRASVRTDAARSGVSRQQQSQSQSQSYTQNLLSRFNLPAPAAASAEAYGVLASALQGVMGGGSGGAGSGSHESAARDLSSSGSLVPPDLGREERLSYIAAQKERLGILMRAFDNEAEAEVGANRTIGESGMRKSKSEMEFDTIDRDEAGGKVAKAGSGGSWMPWSWSAKGDDVSTERKKQ